MAFSRDLVTNISDYIKGEEVNVLRQRKLLALLQSRGRISFKHYGYPDMQWLVRYRENPFQGYVDGETLTFAPRDRWVRAVLPWRGYAATDAMSKLQRLVNRGPSALINAWESITKALMDDLKNGFGTELYQDGNLAGKTKGLHGIQSFTGGTGTTRAYIYDPSDSFAGLNTDLADKGGTWTGTWPSGTGDAHYDYWAPLLVRATATDWAAGATFKQNAIESVRFGILYAQKNATKDGTLDTVLLERDSYRMFLQLIDAKERINPTGSELVKLGFKDVINFDGVELTTEYGLPSAIRGFGFNLDQMELKSLNDSLFDVEAPDYDLSTKSHRLSIDFLGNCTWNPRYFVMWKD